ncbi:ABC transporter substrate-binding protein [Corynebacterium mendelii]|uniref:Iron-siderophore ABC transporter substrate-binding protein n=1 Tax=Corynebacterium mendelii TaxID=2765362 RepID=A0A939IU00_9CORY|nr:iron-siderophore ABC transporter substrate-binding protein [Corynebacterium mendelii]MBN9644389.1 iron-siderophore ABC transporter substrate-binding protein [Corynebacterium mendelii]
MSLARRMIVLLGTGLFTCVSACSGASPTDQTSATHTRQITDIQDTVVDVPIHPQRIVALSEPTLDGLLALGIKPVGAVAGRGQRDIAPYLKDRTEGVELLGNVAQPNFEAVGAAQPDLILVDGTSINNNPPVVEALRRIAPVVYTGYAGGDWKENFRNTANAVNMVDKGEEVLASYDNNVAETRKKLGDLANDTYSVVRWQGNSASMILKDLPPGMALTDLGLKRPPNQDRRGRGHSEPVSAENLQEIDADWIFFGTLGGSSVANPDNGGDAGVQGAKDALKQAEEVPGFSTLNAYKKGHIVPVQGAVWTSTGGPILMNHIIDDVARFAEENSK